MKIDLIEINKLTPPGLWDLGLLASVIAMLRGVLASGHGPALLYGRMLLQYSESLRERTRDNLNIRIKAWILLCPMRIAQVRCVIGEAAIKRWHKNRLADYALSKYFGDWRRKWPDGFSAGFTDRFARQNMNASFEYAVVTTRKIRPYNWKPFALVKIENVYGFLYGKTVPDPEIQDRRAAHIKLWGVDIMDVDDGEKWQQPRPQRALKPVRFTPYELAIQEDASLEVLDVIEDEKSLTARPALPPPDETEKIENQTAERPEIDKPP